MKDINIKSMMALFCAVVLMGFSSCTGDLDVTPIDPSVTQEFNQDGVFAKIYAAMVLTGQKGPDGAGDVDGIDEGTSAFYRLIFTLNEYPTDEAICSWGDPGIPELNFISWSSSHDQVTGLYARLNFNVALCNHFLEMTEGQTDDVSVKQRAEVRFMRALNFYYLMDFYGNVPFTEIITDELPDQISRKDLFAYIENELQEIESDMYTAQTAPYGRADQVANWLLRARMYLNGEVYTGTAYWTQAATYAKKVMDSSYRLAPVYAHLFMADNDGSAVNQAKQEIILPIRHDGVLTQSYGGSFYSIAATHTEGMNEWGSTDGWGGVRARAALVQKFFSNLNSVPTGDENDMVVAAGDDRALFFYGNDRTVEIENVNTFKEGLSVAKWSNLRADGASTKDSKFPDTDVPFFRLAEANLIFAEATLRSNGSMNDAVNAINELRDRANASRFSTITLANILDERAREFYFEGHRRVDLVRYGYFTSNEYIWDWKGGAINGTSVNSIYNIYPIPYSDLTANNKLKQNPGY
ncbi:MAG: RagB/SusD family nutrient uptake outer membrane protein [Tannerellaceae bacterium]|nr:RagB/SusD family nutrient uptake outer membrane protein [Tannerellaceae bacterium]